VFLVGDLQHPRFLAGVGGVLVDPLQLDEYVSKQTLAKYGNGNPRDNMVG
jgi:hypothetical protein